MSAYFNVGWGSRSLAIPLPVLCGMLCAALGGCALVGDFDFEGQARFDASTAARDGSAGSAGAEDAGKDGSSGTGGAGVKDSSSEDTTLPEASVGGASGAADAGGGAGTAGNAGGGGTGTVAQGLPCEEDWECQSGHCWKDPPATSGVCCKDSCDGVCQACIHKWTNKANGLCYWVAGEHDPWDQCNDPPADTCGNSGVCSCFDGHFGGLETDVDCGGPICQERCKRTQWCQTNLDCKPGDECTNGELNTTVCCASVCATGCYCEPTYGSGCVCPDAGGE